MNKDRLAAQAALEQHDFTAATKLLRQHLSRVPDDLEAELELVVAQFMNGNDEPLLALHERVDSTFAAAPPREGRLARLWAVCQQLFRQFQHAAAIATCAAMPLVAGCDKPADGPADHPVTVEPSATAQPTATATEAAPTTTETAAPTATPTAEPTAAPTAAETASPPPATSTLPPVTNTKPATKYAVMYPKYGVKRPPAARYMVRPKMRYRVNSPF